MESRTLNNAAKGETMMTWIIESFFLVTVLFLGFSPIMALTFAAAEVLKVPKDTRQLIFIWVTFGSWIFFVIAGMIVAIAGPLDTSTVWKLIHEWPLQLAVVFGVSSSMIAIPLMFLGIVRRKEIGE